MAIGDGTVHDGVVREREVELRTDVQEGTKETTFQEIEGWNIRFLS